MLPLLPFTMLFLTPLRLGVRFVRFFCILLIFTMSILSILDLLFTVIYRQLFYTILHYFSDPPHLEKFDCFSSYSPFFAIYKSEGQTPACNKGSHLPGYGYGDLYAFKQVAKLHNILCGHKYKYRDRIGCPH